MARWTRHGVPAGVSTVLAFLAGALTNVFTQGWNWPVGVSLGVLLAGFGWHQYRRPSANENVIRGNGDVAGAGHAGRAACIVSKNRRAVSSSSLVKDCIAVTRRSMSGPKNVHPSSTAVGSTVSSTRRRSAESRERRT